jgi:transcriptional regulator with XRE-family HTH domain
MTRRIPRRTEGQTRLCRPKPGVEWPVRSAESARTGRGNTWRERMESNRLRTGVVLQFAKRRAAHESGLDGNPLGAHRALVQRQELLTEVEARALGDSARQTADGRLSDAALLGDLRLHEVPGDEVGDQSLPVHVSSPKHRYADIVHSGLPIVNIGKLMSVPNRDRTPFGHRLLTARKAAGMTQPQVAERLGMSQGTIAELEKKGQGSSRTIEFAALYGVDAGWLATGEESGQVAPPTPPVGFQDRHEVSDSDWGLLMDVKIATTEKEKQDIRERAAELRAQVTRQLAQVSRAPKPDQSKPADEFVGGMSAFGDLAEEPKAARRK